MKHILIALNPSKDKDGVILSNVISKVSRKFNGVKIKVLNSYELAFNEIDDEIIENMDIEGCNKNK